MIVGRPFLPPLQAISFSCPSCSSCLASPLLFVICMLQSLHIFLVSSCIFLPVFFLFPCIPFPLFITFLRSFSSTSSPSLFFFPLYFSFKSTPSFQHPLSACVLCPFFLPSSVILPQPCPFLSSSLPFFYFLTYFFPWIISLHSSLFLSFHFIFLFQLSFSSSSSSHFLHFPAPSTHFPSRHVFLSFLTVPPTSFPSPHGLYPIIYLTLCLHSASTGFLSAPLLPLPLLPSFPPSLLLLRVLIVTSPLSPSPLILTFPPP